MVKKMENNNQQMKTKKTKENFSTVSINSDLLKQFLKIKLELSRELAQQLTYSQTLECLIKIYEEYKIKEGN